MKIVFVRHGEPNYANDCLTPLGALQAEAVARVLDRYRFDRIYASECGRAVETAAHTAKRQNLPVLTLGFMNEIAWDPADMTEEEKKNKTFHPWRMADRFAKSGEDFNCLTETAKITYNRSQMPKTTQAAADGFDDFLLSEGYRRTASGVYLCERENEGTLAVFSHAGASSAVMAHLLGVPFLYFLSRVPLQLTGITEVTLTAAVGECAPARFPLMNESAHLAGLQTDKPALPDR